MPRGGGLSDHIQVDRIFKNLDSGSTPKEIAKEERISASTINRLRRVRNLLRQDMPYDEIMRRVGYTTLKAIEDIAVVDSKLSRANDPEINIRLWDQHYDVLCAAARHVIGKIPVFPDYWPAPEMISFDRDLSQSPRQVLLWSHLKDSEEMRVVKEAVETHRQAVSQARQLIKRLDEQYGPTSGTEGRYPGFVAALYNMIIQRSGGLSGTGDRYDYERVGDLWILKKAWWIAYAKERSQLEEFEARHKKAIQTELNSRDLRKLRTLADEVKEQVQNARNKLSALIIGEDFPGYCERCPLRGG